MIRKVLAIGLVVIGVGVQAWLLNATVFWLWVGGVFPGRHPAAGRNAALCSFPCVLIFVVQATILWYVAVRPFMRSLRDQQRRESECPKCGYNLTGNVSGRCPECGAEAEATKQHH